MRSKGKGKEMKVETPEAIVERQTETVETSVQPQAPTGPSQPRSFSVTLHGPNAQLRFQAVGKRYGAQSFVVHSTKDSNGKRQNSRGGTQKHASLAEAVAACEEHASRAVERGWQRSTRAAGFRARPDAFDVQHLPAPPVARVTSKKTAA